MTDKLVTPKLQSDVENAIENAQLMIEESVADVRALNNGNRVAKPSYKGDDYDEGYAQGRKDACRIILLSFGITATARSYDHSSHQA